METIQTIVRNKLRVNRLAACLVFPLAIGDLACASVAAAATLQVTNCDDDGTGSLRATLAIAQNGDTIDLTTLTCGKISLATGALDVAIDDLTLQGPGSGALTIGGNGAVYHYSVIDHRGHGTLRIDSLRITDAFAHRECVGSTGTVYLNHSTITECHGGGVSANGFSARYSTISNNVGGIQTRDGNVSIIGSTITGNSAAFGCAAFRLGYSLNTPAVALIANTTISGNFAGPIYGYGGGCIYARPTITNSTIAFNTNGLRFVATPDVVIESSLFALNDGQDLAIDAGVLHISGHNNLIMKTTAAVPADTIKADPLLLPLADNGGPTRTHALAANSPAIDKGNNVAGLSTDQRGLLFPRIVGARADIGAFELQPASPTSVSIGPGFTGSWFDPDQSGHGLMLEVLSDHRLLAMWFAFNPEGTQQSWFGGVGTYSGATATITDVALPTGGRWIPNFDPDAIVREPWGTLTLTFTDCAHGRIDFNSVRGYGSGSMNLLRLTQPAGLTCP